MSNSSGNLNTLLNYRFMKKTPKLTHLDSANSNKSTDISREHSATQDSQSTIPYNSQNSVLNGDADSQETVAYDSQSANISPSHTNGNLNDSTAVDAPSTSPVIKKISSLSYSPVFKANQNQADKNVSNGNSKPWLTSSSAHTASNSTKSNTGFKRVKRPQGDSDSEDDTFGKASGIKVNPIRLEKLKAIFPKADENKLKRALFAYSTDFNRAVEFVRNDERPVLGSEKPSGAVKRSLNEDEDDDDLPTITGSRKRIKMMPQTPSPTKEQGFNLSHQKEDTQKAAQPSKLVKAVSDQSTKAKNSKKQRREDLSDDDDDEEYDEDYDSCDSEDLENSSKSDIDLYLQFFSEATPDELSALPGCSKKKAELIATFQPFASWEDLYTKFDSTKSLNTTLISGCKDIMRVRNIVRKLMVRCESMSQQMEKVVSTLTGESEHESARIAKQPDLLKSGFNLKPYQLIGLSWLRLMHEQDLNGILADEMGLGKTIQAIAFLAHLLEEGEEGPHVIIVPASTIENWLREIQLWCPALKILVYYGSQDERRAVRHSIFVDQEEFNVLLTTYKMATGGSEDRVLFKKFEFHYAIFDEGHMLKNMSSLRFQSLMKIVAERRLLLTGTPLQNNLLELMSLLCFVMPEIFQGKTDSLKKMFTMISRSEDNKKSRYESERIQQAKRIMKPFILRRLKINVLKQLPQKTEKIIRCPLVESQRVLYDKMVSGYVQLVEEREKQGGSAVGPGGSSVFMQFRKVANHPLLVRNLYTDDKLKTMSEKIAKEPSHRDRGALPKLIQEDMEQMNDYDLHGLCKQYKKYVGKFELEPSDITHSGKMKMLDQLLPEMKEKGDRVLLFSQFTMMLDVFEPYLEQRQHKFIRLDGQTPVTDRLQLIDRFTNEPDIFIFLLSTRAGGLGINLVAANTIILHDIDFNPYNDKQAEDRCHRLGQTREVKVFRLIGEDTVDESMLRCANSKLALEKDLTDTGHGEEGEENTKDVANLLKEVLKQRQKVKGKESRGDNRSKGAASSKVIEIGESGSEEEEDDGVVWPK